MLLSLYKAIRTETQKFQSRITGVQWLAFKNDLDNLQAGILAAALPPLLNP